MCVFYILSKVTCSLFVCDEGIFKNAAQVMMSANRVSDVNVSH